MSLQSQDSSTSYKRKFGFSTILNLILVALASDIKTSVISNNGIN